jgi:hypothetical protein
MYWSGLVAWGEEKGGGDRYVSLRHKGTMHGGVGS